MLIFRDDLWAQFLFLFAVCYYVLKIKIIDCIYTKNNAFNRYTVY